VGQHIVVEARGLLKKACSVTVAARAVFPRVKTTMAATASREQFCKSKPVIYLPLLSVEHIT
jgi:hypothetical protein